MPEIVEPRKGAPVYTLQQHSPVWAPAEDAALVETGPWACVPEHMRSVVRVYINSEQPGDKEHAMQLCGRYSLDYATMRRVVLDEMIAEGRALGKAWTPADGSRPLSPERNEL